MTFTITSEDAAPIPAARQGFKTAGPAPYGLDTLAIGKMAFIPIEANVTALKHAQTSMSKATNYLAGYVYNRFRHHRHLKGRTVTVRIHGAGIRVWRTT